MNNMTANKLLKLISYSKDCNWNFLESISINEFKEFIIMIEKINLNNIDKYNKNKIDLARVLNVIYDYDNFINWCNSNKDYNTWDKHGLFDKENYKCVVKRHIKELISNSKEYFEFCRVDIIKKLEEILM
ncbi:hypothetical protein [Clostridioides sp. ZZV15-6597]|uniref:hypothetical protein n=1 Tax=Clostridioides sp. ZZV15-6597 TaxID=2811500 RepID=UPI001D104F9D|nr:hypothetical protein [Clostridioides sp. ZZV15-6597]HBF1820603.1 hypothetical protein [Clostridioides difficile]